MMGEEDLRRDTKGLGSRALLLVAIVVLLGLASLIESFRHRKEPEAKDGTSGHLSRPGNLR